MKISRRKLHKDSKINPIKDWLEKNSDPREGSMTKRQRNEYNNLSLVMKQIIRNGLYLQGSFLTKQDYLNSKIYYKNIRLTL